MPVRAKFKVMSVARHPSENPEDLSARITMMPVINDDPENESWSRHNASGPLTMTLTGSDVLAAFETGKSYFVDFTPVD